MGVAMPVAAEADSMFRIPSLSYASDAEVNSITRTGFIISPDWSLSGEVNLGGTGGALLDDPEGWRSAASSVTTGSLAISFLLLVRRRQRARRSTVQVGAELLRHRTRQVRLFVRAPHGLRYGWLRLRRARSEEHGHRSLGQRDAGRLAYGGGLEYFWNRDINLHAGYRRIDFDDQTFSSLPAGQNTLSPEMDIIDFGLMTRF